MTKIQKQALRKGTEIAVYEIRDVLGSNSSEIAYHAWNEHLNAMVILKEFFPSDYAERYDGDQSVQEKSKKDSAVFEFGINNFIQQNEKLLGIQHPGVQGAHNVLKFNHTAYFAVNDDQGALLSEQLEKSKSFSEEELRIVLTSVLNALKNTHEAGIVHGDIHPDNILIRKNGEPVLINFAAAHQGFAEHVKMLAFELHEGYASPEQYEKGDHVGVSADLYSLGVTLYRCITRTDPKDARKRKLGLNDNKADPLMSIFEQAETGFSDDFLQTIDWMLQLDVKARPQSASEVLTELNKDNKNLNAIEATTSVKIETKTGNDADTESKGGHAGAVSALAGMVGAVAIGSVLIWLLQKNEINQVPNISEPEKQVEVAPVVAESGSDNSDEIQTMEKDIGPEQTAPAKSEQKVEPVVVNKILAKDDLIKQYMARADESLAELRLTTPSEDNAYFYYKSVLEIAPDHEGAREGVRQIVDDYIQLIDKAIEKDQPKFAQAYLNRAKNILPNSPLLKNKTDELKRYLALPED